MNRRGERGQILPIGAVAILVLIGIAGLVMDVGATWLLLRREQAAVDVASVAAARYVPDGDTNGMETAACFYARENGFFQDATSNDLSGTGCVPANDHHGAVLTVHFPPVSAPYAGMAGFVEVTLDGAHGTFFARVFGINTMAASANAISGNLEVPPNTGAQLVSLDPTGCDAGHIHGNGVVNLDGAVYVNSDGSQPSPGCSDALDDACSGGNGAFSISGSNVLLDTPLLTVRGSCGRTSNVFPGNCTTPCLIDEGANQIADPFNFVTPTRAWAGVPSPGAKWSGGLVDLSGCDGPTDTGGCSFGGGGPPTAPKRWYELYPGTYYSGWSVQGVVCLHEGFYYFAGGGIQVSGRDGRIVTLADGEDCATVAQDPLLGGEGRILLYGTDGPDCPLIIDPLAPDRRCQGTFSLTGSGGFQAKGYEMTGTVVRDGTTDEPYHRLLVWQSQYQEDGATPTRLTYPGETDFGNDGISIAGGGYLDFWGTVYAPKSLVKVTGGGSGLGDVAGVEIVSWRFSIGGNGTLDMPFDADEVAGIVAKGLVQ